MKVLLNEVKNVQGFIKAATNIMSEVDVKSGHYVLDGKSIMGLYSLDLSKPIEVEVREVIPGEKAQFEAAIRTLGIVVE